MKKIVANIEVLTSGWTPLIFERNYDSPLSSHSMLKFRVSADPSTSSAGLGAEILKLSCAECKKVRVTVKRDLSGTN